jgi:hypothetical protein
MLNVDDNYFNTGCVIGISFAIPIFLGIATTDFPTGVCAAIFSEHSPLYTSCQMPLAGFAACVPLAVGAGMGHICDLAKNVFDQMV